MKIVVREASLEDAPLIAELTRKAWADKCPPISGGHHDTWQKVNEDLHAGGAFILMADDIPAGSLRWAPLDEIDELRLFLHRYLEPLTSLYEAYGFELAPEIEFSARDSMDISPIMMRRVLNQ